MDYLIAETNYGPAIRFRDWEVENGRLQAPGGTVQFFGEDDTQVTFAVYPIGGGGDVEQTLSFEVERLAPSGSMAVQFNDNPWRHVENEGFTCTFDESSLTVRLGSQELYRGPHAPLRPGVTHTLKLATLDHRYELVYNDSVVSSGPLDNAKKQNEGTLRLHLSHCDIRLLSYTENFIRHPRQTPRWQKAELLYEETFGRNSLATNWYVNRGTHGGDDQVGDVLVQDDAFVVKHRCVMYSRQAFTGPLAIEAVVTPQPSAAHSAGVTDVIFLWNIDYRGDFIAYLKERERATAPRTDLLNEYPDTPFYWIDFGGTNNRTTRLRRAPNRWMMRQFNDRARLLARGRTYRLTMVQNGNFVEFWVDGQPLIRQYDPNAIARGHMAIRAYNADTKVESLKIWRIR